MRLASRVPIIKLYGTLLVPIQVALSDELVIQLKEDLTLEIGKHAPHGVVIDISGVDILDSFISRAILDMALISQVMGVRTAICGLDPLMAITLVEMGMTLEGVETALNLEAAIELMQRDPHQSDDEFDTQEEPSLVAAR